MSTTSPGSARFASASRRVTEWLAEHTSVSQWSVARVDEDRETHLHVAGEGPLVPGRSTEWPSTLCRRMVAGAPRVVADARLDPAYADLELAAEFPGYAGMPILDADGELFGVLCGLDAEPIDEPDEIDQSMLAMLAGLLTDVLAAARDLDRADDVAASMPQTTETDALTGLLNRPGWLLRAVGTSARHQALGDPYAVMVVDLDRVDEDADEGPQLAGDALVVAAANALLHAVRETDGIARIGAEQFAVLFDGCGEEEAAHRVVQVRSALLMAGIAASVGWAAAPPQVDVSDVLARADERMSTERRLRSSVG